MIVVADTSPLNYLILLGHPEALREIYGRVLIPGAVLIEMRHPEAPPEVRAWASAPPSWLEERQVQQIDGSQSAELGAGEREAISLALEVKADVLLEVKADVLLIDERAGRRAAETRRIAVAGHSLFSCKHPYADTSSSPKPLQQLRRYGFRDFAGSRSADACKVCRG